MWSAAEKLTEHDPPPNFGIWSRDEIEAMRPRKGQKPRAVQMPQKGHQADRKHPPDCAHCAVFRSKEFRDKMRLLHVTRRKASEADARG